MFLSDPSLRRSADTRRLKKAGRAVCVPLTAWGVLAKIGHFVGGGVYVDATRNGDAALRLASNTILGISSRNR
jgi:hypothetical protein